MHTTAATRRRRSSRRSSALLVSALAAVAGLAGSWACSAPSAQGAYAERAEYSGPTVVAEVVEQEPRRREEPVSRSAPPAEPAASWAAPVDGAYRLTATFGQTGLWSSAHTGQDFAAPSGTPVVAVAAGVVTQAAYDGAYGNKLVLTLADGTEIWYAHLSAFGVGLGERVAPGDLLGHVGSTGNSTGPHLHLEIRPGGGDPVDPAAALAERGVRLAG